MAKKRFKIRDKQGNPVDYDISAASVTIDVEGKSLEVKLSELVDAISRSVKSITFNGNSPTMDSNGNVNLGQQMQGDWTEANINWPSYIKNKPSFSRVATTGSYNDLSDKPTIPEGVEADSQMSDSSDAPVKNRVIKAYVDNLISGLINGAPQALDTLNELSAALGNDANFAATIANQLANKANSADVYPKSQTYNKSEVDAKVADAGKVKSVTINGTKKTPNETTGDVDLGTIVGQQGPQGEQGPAGPQGNSGVASADGVIVVNNLVEGGTDVEVEGVTKVKVLSAEMGFKVCEMLDGIVEIYTRDSTYDHDGKYENVNGSYWNNEDYSVSRKIHLDAGQTINVAVTGGHSSGCVIILCSNGVEGEGYKGTNDGSIAYSSGTLSYSYTAPAGGKYVAVGYVKNDGFRAVVTRDSIAAMKERLNGEEIPFRTQTGYYKYASNTLTEVTTSVYDEHHTEPIALAGLKALYFTGQMNKSDAYFCAVWYDSNGDFISTGLTSNRNPLVVNGYDMYNVLDEAPEGAASVVLQSKSTSSIHPKIIAFSETPSFMQNKWWKFDYYGIKGDGATNDTAALQNLIWSSDGLVELKPGKYLISSALSINTKYVRKIVGNGATIILDGDIVGFDVFGSTTGNANPDKTSAQMYDSGFVIEDVHITSADGLAWHDDQSGNDVGTGTAIRMKNTFMATISNCQIYSVENGIQLSGVNRNIIIDGCFIYNCWGSGILFPSGAELHQCNINGNHISYCKYCIDFDSPKQIANFQITGNDIETSETYPTGVTESDKRCIRFNLSSSTQACYEIEIVGNTIQGHGTSAGYLVEVAGRSDFAVDTLMSIVGNHLSNCARVIGLSHAYDVSISGNNVNNVSTGFVYLAGGTIQRVAISGNTMNSGNKYLVGTDSTAALSHISVSGNVGNNTPVSIDGASQDYISVVGNCLGGGTVTIGDATHKQEANNI